MLNSLKTHGTKETLKALGFCLLADVVRGWCWIIGEKRLAAELLAEERKLWTRWHRSGK